jgi:surface carbohydrate biosynthesis protein
VKIVFLPTEVLNRELTARAFLSTKLANNGNKVYVFEHTFFDRNGWDESGIYIGKNCFRTEVPYTKKYYRSMKKSGISVWYLDEEGGVYSGNKENQEKRLLTRLSPGDLQEDDKILSWGRWQKKTYESVHHVSPVSISGLPNFDILQSKYNNSFLDYDLKITGGKKDFILINTRFSIGNPKQDIDSMFGNKQPHSENLPEFFLESLYIADNKMLFSMIELCFYLSKSLPNELIIIRPHPAEDLKIYNILTKKLKNVLVIHKGGSEPWIRMSKVLIHNGCTTAVQADIADKKVISFMPGGSSELDKEYVPEIPNKIGIVATTNEEVLSAINRKSSNSNDIWKDTISELDSIEIISKLVNEETVSEDIHIESIHNHGLFFSERVKDVARGIVNYIVPSRKNKGFDYKEFSTIVDLVKIANDYYKSNVKCKKITNGCYCIYK